MIAILYCTLYSGNSDSTLVLPLTHTYIIDTSQIFIAVYAG